MTVPFPVHTRHSGGCQAVSPHLDSRPQLLYLLFILQWWRKGLPGRLQEASRCHWPAQP